MWRRMSHLLGYLLVLHDFARRLLWQMERLLCLLADNSDRIVRCHFNVFIRYGFCWKLLLWLVMHSRNTSILQALMKRRNWRFWPTVWPLSQGSCRVTLSIHWLVLLSRNNDIRLHLRSLNYKLLRLYSRYDGFACMPWIWNCDISCGIVIP